MRLYPCMVVPGGSCDWLLSPNRLCRVAASPGNPAHGVQGGRDAVLVVVASSERWRGPWLVDLGRAQSAFVSWFIFFSLSVCEWAQDVPEAVGRDVCFPSLGRLSDVSFCCRSHWCCCLGACGCWFYGERLSWVWFLLDGGEVLFALFVLFLPQAGLFACRIAGGCCSGACSCCVVAGACPPAWCCWP